MSCEEGSVQNEVNGNTVLSGQNLKLSICKLEDNILFQTSKNSNSSRKNLSTIHK